MAAFAVACATQRKALQAFIIIQHAPDLMSCQYQSWLDLGAVKAGHEGGCVNGISCFVYEHVMMARNAAQSVPACHCSRMNEAFRFHIFAGDTMLVA